MLRNSICIAQLTEVGQHGATAQYNGNIAEQEYGGQNIVYAYDALNRITGGTSTEGFAETGIAYDPMGNIQTLNRDAAGSSTYSYSGNQLQGISGNSVSTATNYLYDGNGNATTDGRNNRTLEYNYLNLITAVKNGGTTVASYTWDATGNKLTKTADTTTNYVNGIQYKGTAIDFIQTEEGRAQLISGSYQYQYNLTDHLGNVRRTFDLNGSGGTARVIQSDEYYPFGMRTGSGIANKYLYNGKELQGELGQYDFGARFYDPVIGRWLTVDPLAELGRRWSPYGYGFDDPTRFTDPDGMWPDDDDPGVLSVTGNFLGGLGQSAWGTVTGVYGIVRHPINTATAIGNAVAHPINTAKAIGNAVSEGYYDFQNGNGDVKANIAGNVIGDVAQLFVGAGEAKVAVNGISGRKSLKEPDRSLKFLCR